jgi:hypothetical protein
MAKGANFFFPDAPTVIDFGAMAAGHKFFSAGAEFFSQKPAHRSDSVLANIGQER